MRAALKIFISYSHADKTAKDRFLQHVKPLEAMNLVKTWHDEEISAGKLLDQEIKNQLDEYDLIIFLLSPDFLSSNYCMNIEFDHCLKNSKRLIPIVLKHCSWKYSAFKNFKLLPYDAKPIFSHTDPDEAWALVVDNLVDAINEYKSLTETNNEQYIEVSETAENQISTEFWAHLNDTEIVYNHKHKDDVKLPDVYIFPDLRTYSENDEDIEITSSSEKLSSNNLKKVLILGEEQSGKTSLAKMLFIEFQKNGDLPLLIESSSINKTDLSKALQPIIKNQYENIDFSSFLESEKNKIAIIDDFSETNLNKKHLLKYLENLENSFDKLIIFSDSSLKFSELESTYFSSYTQREILNFGYLLRSKIIKKWICLGQEETISDSEIIRKSDHLSRQIDILLKKNIVPSKPVFILTAVQTIESHSPSDYGLTSHGHCYNSFIQQSLKKTNIKNKDIDSFINFMTEIAYFIYQSDKYFITLEEMKDFKNYYHSNFFSPLKHEEILEKLSDAGILKLKSDKFYFCYKYIFYFYSAKYISDNLNNKNIKNTITLLCEKIHSEKHSNILLFITHHSKSTEVIDEIRLYASGTFDHLKPCALNEDDVSDLKDFIESIPELVMESRDVIQERERKLIEKDKAEKHISSSDTYNNEDDDISTEENLDEFNKNFASVTKSSKSVEIIGQIVRNRYGSLKRENLKDLVLEAYDAGLRFLKFYLSIADKHKEEITNKIVELIEEKESIEDDKLKKTARLYYLSLCYGAILGVIRKIALSVGSDNLIELFDEIAEGSKTKNPAYKLIQLAIHLEFKSEYPKRIISEFNSLYCDNPIYKRILQHMIVQHNYMYYVDYNDKQWISEKLEIPIETQRASEHDKKQKFLKAKN